MTLKWYNIALLLSLWMMMSDNDWNLLCYSCFSDLGRNTKQTPQLLGLAPNCMGVRPIHHGLKCYWQYCSFQAALIVVFVCRWFTYFTHDRRFTWSTVVCNLSSTCSTDQIIKLNAKSWSTLTPNTWSVQES